MGHMDIKSMDIDELEGVLTSIGEPRFRAGQIYGWLHQKYAKSFDDMSNLPLSLRSELAGGYYIAGCDIEKKLVSQRDGTVKYLLSLIDGEFIESVTMDYKHGRTVCISSQVGCKMACEFCATGKGGFIRDLTASEMLVQVQEAQADGGVRISNIVLMGMGEPLDNYDNVVRFLRLVSSSGGMNIGVRHISLSTCGIIKNIYRLAEEGFQLTLSVSLHAPDDDMRSGIMPINKTCSVDELLKACRFYIHKTNRRISFEYAMIDGVNDSTKCAKMLAKKLNSMLCHVNLIPVNPIGNTHRYNITSRHANIERFMSELTKNGISVTVRRTLGADINASCGQLRGNQ